MTVEFDADTGRLRLARSDFAALVGWAGGGAPPDATMAALVDAGVLRGGRPHEVVQPLLEAVTDPVCRFTVRRDGADHASGWATLGAAAVLLPLPGDRCEVAGLHPSFVPAGLARLMGLGPRRRHPGEPWQLPAGVLTALLAPPTTSARPRWPRSTGRPSRRLVTTHRSWWRRWPQGAAGAGRSRWSGRRLRASRAGGRSTCSTPARSGSGCSSRPGTESWSGRPRRPQCGAR